MSRSTIIWTFETTITDPSETTHPPTSTPTVKSTSVPSGVAQVTTTAPPSQSSSVTPLPSDTSIALVSTRTVTLSISGSSRRASGSPSSDSTSSGSSGSSGSSWTSGATPAATPSGSSSVGVTPRSIPVAAIIVGAVAFVALLVCALLLFIRLRHRRKPDIGATPFVMPSTSAPRISSHRFYSSLDSNNDTNTRIVRVASDSYGGEDMTAPNVTGQRIPRNQAEEKQQQSQPFSVTQAEDLRQAHQTSSILAVPPSGIVRQDSGAHLPPREANVIDIPPAYTP